MKLSIFRKRKKVGVIKCLECKRILAELVILEDKSINEPSFELRIDGHIIASFISYTKLADIYKMVQEYWRRCPKCYRKLSETLQVLILNLEERKTYIFHKGELVKWS